jgi:LPS sulfotransferase NodH
MATTDGPTRFCILTSQRSGSTWLVSLLKTIPGVAAHYELFLPHSPSADHAWLLGDGPPGFVDSQTRGASRVRRVARYLDSVERAAPAARAVGFKLMINQAVRYFPETLPILRLRGYRFLLLTRDPLEMAISRYIAQTTKQSHAPSNVTLPEFRIDPQWVRRDIRKRKVEFRIARSALRTLNASWCTLDYRDLVSDTQASLDRVANNLGLPTAPPATDGPTHKLLARPYADQVTNYTELCAIAARQGVGPDARSRV